MEPAAGSETITVATEERARFGPWKTAAVGSLAVWAVSIFSWWLFFDPRWSPLHIYPEPAGAFIFWGILAVVWMAFNLELWPAAMGQPRVGIIQLFGGVIVTVVVIVILAYGWGQVDPAFSYRMPNGAGFTNGTYLVLMGFFFWSLIAVTWDHWPWADHRLKQPVMGTAELFVGLILTLFGFLALVYPNVATWTGKRVIPMQLDVAVGWFYSAIVALIFVAQFWENWPWTTFRNRALRAVASLAGLLLFGTVIYFVSQAWLNVLVPPAIRRMPSFSAVQVADLGVCVNSVSLTWGLVVKRFVGRWPFPNRPRLTGLVFMVASFFLGSLIYFVYMRWAGTQVLHEPTLLGHYGGNPLLGMDWIILVLFWYAISFDLYGLVAQGVRGGADARLKLPLAQPSE